MTDLDSVKIVDLDTFHEVSGRQSFARPMESLLDEFRRGNIADPARSKEDSAVRLHLGALFAAWEEVFPEFPHCRFRRRSIGSEWKRGRRDAYLRELVASWVPRDDDGRKLVFNPATVFGRHARAVADTMRGYQVLGCDTDPRWDRLYRIVEPFFYPKLGNYAFIRESIYDPDPTRRPAAVIFFGACGAVTDASMDYAVGTGAPFLICRSCCHDNIGGNTRIVKRPGGLNRFFRFKNYGFASGKVKRTWPYYHYFSDRYGKDAYPRSRLAREFMDSETIRAVASNSVDSDICRFLIDLDRCQYLVENGYDVLYREELFFAHRRRRG